MGDRFHVATRKGLFTVEKKNSGWSITNTNFLGDPVSIVLFDPRDDSLYAALNLEQFGVKLHRSRDGGKSWDELAVPVYPEIPADYKPKIAPAEGESVPWALKLIWALEPGSSKQNGVIWCGTLPGGLFRSDNHGESWELNRPLWDDPQREEWFGGGAQYPGIHSVAVDPRNHDNIVIGISCGGAWITNDGGKTWYCGGNGMRAEYMPPERAFDANIQDPHLLVQCQANPDVLWVQHHNGIFKSTDRANSWTEIKDVKPSVFGFAVAVHPHNPNIAWFIPAIKDEHRIPLDGKVVVNRTNDGGISFTRLTNGLPQNHAYDLVYRHALDIDETGNRLAFGSTTGSLWISEDQGDTWTTISTNLPPVYAVRFEKPSV